MSVVLPILFAGVIAMVCACFLAERLYRMAYRRWGTRTAGALTIAMWMAAVGVLLAALVALEQGAAVLIAFLILSAVATALFFTWRTERRAERQLEGAHSSGERLAAKTALQSIRSASAGGGELSPPNDTGSGAVSLAPDTRGGVSPTKRET